MRKREIKGAEGVQGDRLTALAEGDASTVKVICRRSAAFLYHNAKLFFWSALKSDRDAVAVIEALLDRQSPERSASREGL